jgi:hypothetical protein
VTSDAAHARRDVGLRPFRALVVPVLARVPSLYARGLLVAGGDAVVQPGLALVHLAMHLVILGRVVLGVLTRLLRAFAGSRRSLLRALGPVFAGLAELVVAHRC